MGGSDFSISQTSNPDVVKPWGYFLPQKMTNKPQKRLYLKSIGGKKGPLKFVPIRSSNFVLEGLS